MNATRHVFHHTFRLVTTDGNDCVQPVVAVLEETGFLRWHHVPARWLRPPNERDQKEWREWVEQSGVTVRQLADEFYFVNWMEDKL